MFLGKYNSYYNLETKEIGLENTANLTEQDEPIAPKQQRPIVSTKSIVSNDQQSELTIALIAIIIGLVIVICYFLYKKLTSNRNTNI